LGSTEIWEVTPNMMAHPFHVHGVVFRVLSIGGEPPAPHLAGGKDTILLDAPGELLMTFTQPATHDFPFMFHCHILEHEDHEMMRQFEVVACPVDWTCPGDANGDGSTNLADLNIVLANFGAGPDAAFGQGDLNCDGFVNLADLNLILANFGCAP
ncbi:MAG: multicopper oxidase domain-containing protein, partial [Phycisphaerales bacterium]